MGFFFGVKLGRCNADVMQRAAPEIYAVCEADSWIRGIRWNGRPKGVEIIARATDGLFGNRRTNVHHCGVFLPALRSRLFLIGFLYILYL